MKKNFIALMVSVFTIIALLSCKKEDPKPDPKPTPTPTTPAVIGTVSGAGVVDTIGYGTSTVVTAVISGATTISAKLNGTTVEVTNSSVAVTAAKPGDVIAFTAIGSDGIPVTKSVGLHVASALRTTICNVWYKCTEVLVTTPSGSTNSIPPGSCQKYFLKLNGTGTVDATCSVGKVYPGTYNFSPDENQIQFFSSDWRNIGTVTSQELRLWYTQTDGTKITEIYKVQ